MRDLIGGENTAVLKQSVIKIRGFLFMLYESHFYRKKCDDVHPLFQLALYLNKPTNGLDKGPSSQASVKW